MRHRLISSLFMILVAAFKSSSRTATLRMMASTTSHAGREARLYIGTEAVEMLTSRTRVPASPITCPALFVTWARQIVKRKLVTDPEFKCRAALRDLRKAHSPQLQEVERRVHEARLLYDMHEHSALLEKLDADINGAEQAVASMSKFLSRETGSASSGTASSTSSSTGTVSSSEERVLLKQEHVRDLLPEKRAELALKLRQREALRAELTEYQDLQASIQVRFSPKKLSPTGLPFTLSLKVVVLPLPFPPYFIYSLDCVRTLEHT